MTCTANEKVKRRVVSNEEFRRAYNGDSSDPASLKAASDNRSVIAAVLRGYAKSIPEEDLEFCGLHAMWRCLQYHQPGFNQKFTTSLHRFTHWECRRMLRRLQKQSAGEKLVGAGDRRVDQDLELMSQKAEDLQHVVECMDFLPHEWQKRVVRQYYLEGMTIGQVGEANGYSKETARQRIRKSVEALRRICLRSLERCT